MSFLTVKKESQHPDCPYSLYQLQKMIHRHEIPGIYSGNRFLVNHEMLMEQIRQESLSRKRPAEKAI